MVENEFVAFVREQLRLVSGVEFRAMFGGHGIYQHGVFFGIVSKGSVYFNTGSKNRKDYIDRGMQPFRPNEKQTLKNYYEVPAEILEDEEQLAEWACNAGGNVSEP